MSSTNIRSGSGKSSYTDSSGKKHTVEVRIHNESTYNKGRLTKTGRKVTYVDGKAISAKGHNFTFNLLGIVLVILLAVSLYTLLGAQGGEPKTFYGFLTSLQSVPEISLDWVKIVQFDIPFPDWLSWMNIIFDILTSLLGVVAALVNGIIQAFVFLAWIIGYIFS